LLSDDSQRLALVEAALERDGRAKNFVPLDTQSLPVPAYHRFLHKKFPKMWPEIVSATQTNTLNPLGLMQVLMILSRTNDIYYLHPSYGYYFEAFYQEPHGLAYKMKPLSDETLLPPKADTNLIAENESFWTQAAPTFNSIEKAIVPPDPNAPQPFGDKVLNYFHVPREQNQNAASAGMYYSRSADFWGMELQRAGELEKAAAQFALATNLNPDNLVAKINFELNAKLRAHETVPVDLSKATPDQFGKFNSWNDLLNLNGPFDEPSFCFQNGIILANANGFFRQAVAQFERARELAPTFLPARLELARVYLLNHLPDRALEALEEPLAHPEKFSIAETNETTL
ncbi:MAG TPA: tetratricopeptide repeat protein, partial [Candidatus Baltobacteraceae bacterium]|nr:tetratricopeptide repeat protein [Candidatus Baltobacteraceae bacterium]